MLSCFADHRELAPRAVVVGPDDLVHEAVLPEDFVEHHLAVVHLAVVDVEEEAALGSQQPQRLPEPRAHERQIVVEGIVEGATPQPFGAVSVALVAGSVAGLVPHRAQPEPPLGASGVEGRVDVNEVKGEVGQGLEDVEVVAEHDAPPGRCARTGR